MSKSNRVIIIVINHHTTPILKELLFNFISSLPNYPQIRVDWAVSDVSKNNEDELDDSFEKEMKEEFKNKKRNFFHFFEIPNEGFARNVNQTFQLFLDKNFKDSPLRGDELVFLLNPDTSLYWANLEKAVKFMNECEKAEVAGLSLMNPGGQKEKWGHSTVFPSLKFFWNRKRFSKPSFLEEPNQVAWVSGGALITRLKWWRKLKGLDEGFFLYFEDVDFCKRTEILGGKTYFLPEITVGHRRGGSKISIFRRKELFYASEARYFHLYKKSGEYLLLRFIRIPYKFFYFFYSYFRFGFWKEKVKENWEYLQREKAEGFPKFKKSLEQLKSFEFLKEIWLTTIALNLCALGEAFWAFHYLSPPLILHYNAYLGVDFYGNASYFFTFPLLIFLVSIFNFCLSIFLFTSRKYAKYILLLAGGSLLFALLATLGLLNLILVNRP